MNSKMNNKMTKNEQQKFIKDEVIDKTLELSKNLQEPRNEEEQKMLDNIKSEIEDLTNFMGNIIKENDIKHKND